MNLLILVRSSGLAAISIVATYFLLRRGGKERLLARMPVVLECLVFPFYLGVLDLPLALPSAFHLLLGHSIWADYVYPTRPGDSRISETWLTARWLDPLRNIYFAIVVVGIAWAILNMFRGRAWKLNALALVFGLLWLAAGLYLSFLCFPFCF